MPQVVMVKINSYLASRRELTIKPVAQHLTDKALVLHFVIFMHEFAVLVNLFCSKVCAILSSQDKREVLAVALVLQLVAFITPVMFFRIYVLAIPPSSLLPHGGHFK